MGVSKNRGTPKWMVYILENPIKIDDLGGPPLFLVQHPNQLSILVGFWKLSICCDRKEDVFSGDHPGRFFFRTEILQRTDWQTGD